MDLCALACGVQVDKSGEQMNGKCAYNAQQVGSEDVIRA